MIIQFIDKFTKHVAVRFVISGGSSAFVDLLILYILNSVFGVHYLTAAILAFICAFGVSFTLHKFWTFKSHIESAHKQAVMYLATSLFGLLLNTLLMYVFVDKFHVVVLLAQMIVGIIVAFFSFFLSHNFVFKYNKNDTVKINIQ